MPWFKGNLHTHTNNSDGMNSLEEVVKTYEDLGYDFLFITDHNYVTPVNGLDNNKILVIPGCEVSLEVEGGVVHVNGFNVKEIEIPDSFSTIRGAIQSAADAILKANGIAQINHPNYKWSVGSEHIKDIKGLTLFEVFNALPLCNNFGGGGKPGNEQIWDELLSQGCILWGTAGDDMHSISPGKNNIFNNEISALPARAWVVVKADEKSPESITESLKEGNFYASTGITIEEIEITDTSYSLQIKQSYDYKYTTYFIGLNGEIFNISFGTNPKYTFKGCEQYIRAKVTDSSGAIVWTRPVLTSRTDKVYSAT